jgi:probable rRNA maturation factor
VTTSEPGVEVIDAACAGWASGPVAAVAERVLAVEGAFGSVVVAFVDEERIAELNARYRMPGSTDVLSFRAEDETEDWPDTLAPAELGEVVICPAVVRRYAIEEGVSEGEQLGWTLVHGVLHLLGYDHETDHGEMRAREQELLRCLAPLIGRLQ